MADARTTYKFESAVTALSGGAATITVPLSYGYRHWFGHVAYYDSAAATSEVVPTSGTETWTATLPGSGEFYAMTNGSVDYAVANDFASWDGATDSVKAVMASISGGGATHCKVTVLGMIS